MYCFIIRKPNLFLLKKQTSMALQCSIQILSQTIACQLQHHEVTKTSEFRQHFDIISLRETHSRGQTVLLKCRDLIHFTDAPSPCIPHFCPRLCPWEKSRLQPSGLTPPPSSMNPWLHRQSVPEKSNHPAPLFSEEFPLPSASWAPLGENSLWEGTWLLQTFWSRKIGRWNLETFVFHPPGKREFW